ncbi:hypothetical protein OIU84_021841 [Salix udensis]|uniref:Uncharacterized protein n=1 Tax=Salix udensis TaxID=889485 RepID=A0AAD6KVI9_9ROSI|nr:hypothetical protein OIU84_021841 [Salix udensis]
MHLHIAFIQCIAYDRPTTDALIRRVYLQSSSGSSVACGREMSGGISNVQVEQVHIYSSYSSACGREMSGGISNVQVEQVHIYSSYSGTEFRTESVSPEPCPELDSSSVSYSLLNSYGKSTDF